MRMMQLQKTSGFVDGVGLSKELKPIYINPAKVVSLVESNDPGFVIVDLGDGDYESVKGDLTGVVSEFNDAINFLF